MDLVTQITDVLAREVENCTSVFLKFPDDVGAKKQLDQASYTLWSVSQTIKHHRGD